MTSAKPWIVADIGNSIIKLGVFHPDAGVPLESPEEIFRTSTSAPELDRLATWLQAYPFAIGLISVNQPTRETLVSWLAQRFPERDVVEIDNRDFPVSIAVRSPDRVGQDRLAAAVAVNRLRSPEAAAVVVDAGSAVTVDFVSVDGHFEGGAILPGWQAMAKSLFHGTDALPELDQLPYSEPPEVVGKSTEQAIASGLYWGSVGAIREIIHRIRQQLASPCEVFVAGGDIHLLTQHLEIPFQHEPQLVLQGIWLTVAHSSSK